jgi:hypothetical protein
MKMFIVTWNKGEFSERFTTTDTAKRFKAALSSNGVSSRWFQLFSNKMARMPDGKNQHGEPVFI